MSATRPVTAQPFDPSDESAVQAFVRGLLDEESPRHLLLVVGEDVPVEWSALTAIRLASTLASGRTDVVLADFAVEQPVLHAPLGAGNDEGLTDYVLFGASLERIQTRLPDRSFNFLSAGPPCFDARPVFRHARLRELIEHLDDQGAHLIAYMPASTYGIGRLVRAFNVVFLGSEDAAGLWQVHWPTSDVIRRLRPAARGELAPAAAAPDEPMLTQARKPAEVAAAEEPEAASPDADKPLAAPSESTPDAPARAAEPDTITASAAPVVSAAANAPDVSAEAHAPDVSAEAHEPDAVAAADESAVIAAGDEPKSTAGSSAPEAAGVVSEQEAVGPPATQRVVAHAAAQDASDTARRDAAVERNATAALLNATRSQEGPSFEKPPAWRRPAAIATLATLLLASGAAYFLWPIGDDAAPASGPDPASETGALPAEPPPPQSVDFSTLTDLSGPLSYSVAVEAHEDLPAATDRMSALQSASGFEFFLSPVIVGGSLFYRVMAGPIADSATAAGVMRSLVDNGLKQGGSDWDVRRTPYAYLIATFDERADAEARARVLHADGVPGYVVEVPYEGGHARYRLYGGAYQGPNEAALMGEWLRDAGLPDSLVERIGLGRS